MTSAAKLTLFVVFFLAALRSLSFLLFRYAPPLNVMDLQGNENRFSSSDCIRNKSVFSGRVVRTFAGAKKLQEALVEPQFSLPLHTASNICEKWGVVYTIHAPTESILKFSSLKDWCLVIVADTATPSDSYFQLVRDSNGRVVFLSVEDQKDLATYSSFVQMIPYESFARKNIGYLFAIRHGAQAIFDFDEEHVLKEAAFSEAPHSPLVLQHENENPKHIRDTTWIVRTINNNNDDEKATPLAFNPLPWMRRIVHKPRAKIKNTTPLSFDPWPWIRTTPLPPEIWPRGFPLRNGKVPSTKNRRWHLSQGPGTTLRSIPRSKVAVIQSTCDPDPDVDAIYRLTRPAALPGTLDEMPATAMRFLVPTGRYAPYNAQATTHLYNAFWGLLLPYSTVSTRVADIWRSYYTQRILHDLGLAVVYSPPLVTHHRFATPHPNKDRVVNWPGMRNVPRKTKALWSLLSRWNDSSPDLPAKIQTLAMTLYKHNYIGSYNVSDMQEWLLALILDLQAELDLYQKTEALLTFLSTWKDASPEIPARMENLAIALYERDYIGLEDVLAMQEWLLALIDTGYKFPSLSGVQEVSHVMKETPVLHEQAIVIPPVYHLGGKDGDWMLYRDFMGSLASSAREEDWNEWLAGSKTFHKQNPTLVPNKIVLSLVIMAKDEWPLLKHNVLYHGHLLGFENLYILDGSTDPRCTTFLVFARDQLGVNVIFSPANLDQLTGEMTVIGQHLVGSSDLLVKIDADEFVALATNDDSCQNTTVGRSPRDCSISPFPMKSFLQNRTNLEHFAGMGRLRIGSVWVSLPDQELCNAGLGDEVASYRYARGNHETFKSIVDARTFAGFDLGGHVNARFDPHEASEAVFMTPVGIIHAHSRCFQHEVENCRKALVSHGYLAESDSPKRSMQKLTMYMGKGGCAISDPSKMAIQGTSVHKVFFYAMYLQRCDGATEDTFYRNSNQNLGSAPSNPDFKVFLDEAISLYT